MRKGQIPNDLWAEMALTQDFFDSKHCALTDKERETLIEKLKKNHEAKKRSRSKN